MLVSGGAAEEEAALVAVAKAIFATHEDRDNRMWWITMHNGVLVPPTVVWQLAKAVEGACMSQTGLDPSSI